MARDHAQTLRRMMSLANDQGTTEQERNHALTSALAFASNHGIDIAMLEKESTDNPVMDRRIAFKNPFAKDKGRLWGVIARNFGCRSVLLQNNVYHTYGFNSDIELALTMYKLLWEHGCSELSMADVPEYVSARSFSTAFWAAYCTKINQRLNEAKNTAVAETSGAELVLVKRTADVENKLNTAYPHLKKAARRYIRSAHGWSAGTMAGERAQFGPSIE